VIVLDASVLIAHLDQRDAQHERAVERLLQLVEQPLACSTITLAEVLVGPARHGRLEVAREAINAVGVVEITVAADAPERLALLRAQTGLKLPGCCVLMAAQDARAASVLTFHDRLARAAMQLGFDAGGLEP
jgi:predicted nucleic acid-binding protein